MAQDKALQIMDLVATKTSSGDLQWAKGAADDVFVATLPSGLSLRMYPYTRLVHDEPDGPASLTIFDEADEIVLDITSELFSVDTERLESLYQLVKNAALGIDRKLQILITDLESIRKAD